MMYINRENPNCLNCNKTGLAILPVRYTVVPSQVNTKLRSNLGQKVSEIELNHHHYTLRTLRQGFVYIYYEKHPQGTQIKWEIYSVSVRGTLWKQLSIESVESVVEERCSRKEHRIPASVICIKSPKNCGRIWIAFSEHKWSSKTFDNFGKHKALREQRMQFFDPEVWIEKNEHLHSMVANENNVNEIIEYKDGFPLSCLLKNMDSPISKMDGSYDASRIKSCSTRYPVIIRRNEKKSLVDSMMQMSKYSNKTQYSPVIFALWDNVGIVHEMNGFRNDAMEWIEKYEYERELEVGAISGIEGARLALENRELTSVISRQEAGVFRWDKESTRARLDAYKKSYPDDKSGFFRQQELCKYWEDDSELRVPTTIARQREAYIGMSQAAWNVGMIEVDHIIDKATVVKSGANKSLIDERDELFKKNTVSAIKHSEKKWAKYQSKIDLEKLNKFKKFHFLIISSATKIANDRTDDLCKWMKSFQLQNSLLEFDETDINDGVAFEDTIGDIIFGISSSPTAVDILKEWISATSVTDVNLIWRAIALNQKEGITAINEILSLISKSKDIRFNESTINVLEGSLKYFAKIADLTKKSLSLHNTLRKPGVFRSPTGGIEKIFLTIGNLFFKPFIKKKC